MSFGIVELLRLKHVFWNLSFNLFSPSSLFLVYDVSEVWSALNCVCCWGFHHLRKNKRVSLSFCSYWEHYERTTCIAFSGIERVLVCFLQCLLQNLYILDHLFCPRMTELVSVRLHFHLNGWCLISSIHAYWAHIRRDAMSYTTGDNLVRHFGGEMLIVWGTWNFVEVPIYRKVTRGTLLRFWINFCPTCLSSIGACLIILSLE